LPNFSYLVAATGGMTAALVVNASTSAAGTLATDALRPFCGKGHVVVGGFGSPPP
jgi:hypothetical protein